MTGRGVVREFIYHLTQSGWDEVALRKELERETASRSEHEAFYRVFDASGAARWTIPPALSGRCLPAPEDIRSVLAGHRQHLRHPRAGRPDSISILYPVPAQDGRSIGCQVGISLGQVQERMAKYAYVFAGVGFAVVAVGAVASYLLLKRPLKRMQAIAAEAARITASNLDRRLPDSHSGDEFGELARTLNVMLDRLAASVQSLERFAGDAAHELRGPVARLRAAADIALESDRLSDADARAALGDIGEHADELSRLIKDLLFLAREEGGTPAAQGPPQMRIASHFARSRSRGSSALMEGFRLPEGEPAEVLVRRPLDRRTREQVHGAVEHRLQFPLQSDERQAGFGAGLERDEDVRIAVGLRLAPRETAEDRQPRHAVPLAHGRQPVLVDVQVFDAHGC